MNRPAIIIGAGPAGLATSRELMARGVDHVVLERGESVGHAWRSLYDSLRLHTGKHMSSLPGMPFAANVPLFPSRDDLLRYLEGYATTFRLPVETSCAAIRIDRASDGWTVHTGRGALAARALVVATGILSNPQLPVLSGRDRFRGTVIHSVDYRRPGPYSNRRVLVVGVGNSGGEIASELARAGVEVTLSVRSGAHALPRQFLGIPIQYFSRLTSWLPRRGQWFVTAGAGWTAQAWRGKSPLPRPGFSPCASAPLIGYQLIEAIRAGLVSVRPEVVAFTDRGVRYADGAVEPQDDVIFATGYRAALGILEGVTTPDGCGFGRREVRVRSEDCPSLFYVGHNYDARGALFNIRQDSRRVARLISRPHVSQPRHGAWYLPST